MKVETHPPAARGVNQLMYVGDDQANIASPQILVAIGAIALVGWLVFGGRRK